MNRVTIHAQIREMDADQLEMESARLLVKRNSTGLTGDEQEALWSIPKHYRTLTGSDLVVDAPPQLVS